MYLTSPPDNFVSNNANEKPPPFMGRRKLGKKRKNRKKRIEAEEKPRLKQNKTIS